MTHCTICESLFPTHAFQRQDQRILQPHDDTIEELEDCRRLPSPRPTLYHFQNFLVRHLYLLVRECHRPTQLLGHLNYTVILDVLDIVAPSINSRSTLWSLRSSTVPIAHRCYLRPYSILAPLPSDLSTSFFLTLTCPQRIRRALDCPMHTSSRKTSRGTPGRFVAPSCLSTIPVSSRPTHY